MLLGYFGELHPKYAEKYGMRIVCFELFNNNFPNTLKKKLNKNYINYSLMPIKRDFAFFVNFNTNASEIINSIKISFSYVNHVDLLEVNLFDIYVENLSKTNKKSLAVEVVFQPNEKTLKESEISNISALIITNVQKNTNAILRE